MYIDISERRDFVEKTKRKRSYYFEIMPLSNFAMDTIIYVNSFKGRYVRNRM